MVTMGATLRSIKGKVAQVRICLSPEIPEEARTDDDYFDVGYRQYAYTAAEDALAKKFRDEGLQVDNLISQIPPIIAWWTLKPGASEEQYNRLESAKSEVQYATNDIDRKAARDNLRAIEAEIKATVDAQEPVALTFEALREHVPYSLAVLIFEQIGESRRPDPSATGQPSQVG